MTESVIIEALGLKAFGTVSMAVFVLIFLVKVNISLRTSLPIDSPLFILQIALVNHLIRVFLLLFLVQRRSPITSNLPPLFLVRRRSPRTSSLTRCSSETLWSHHKLAIPHASRSNPQAEMDLQICIVGLQASSVLVSHLTTRETKVGTGLTTLSRLGSTMVRPGTVNSKTMKMTTITMVDLNRKMVGQTTPLMKIGLFKRPMRKKPIMTLTPITQ